MGHELLKCWGSFRYGKATYILCYKEASPDTEDLKEGIGYIHTISRLCGQVLPVAKGPI